MPTRTPLDRWVRTALTLQVRLNEAMAQVSLLAHAGAVEPDAIIAEVAAPLDSSEAITDEHIAQEISELRRQNEAHMAKVAESLPPSRVTVTRSPAEGDTEH